MTFSANNDTVSLFTAGPIYGRFGISREEIYKFLRYNEEEMGVTSDYPVNLHRLVVSESGFRAPIGPDMTLGTLYQRYQHQQIELSHPSRTFSQI